MSFLRSANTVPFIAAAPEQRLHHCLPSRPSFHEVRLCGIRAGFLLCVLAFKAKASQSEFYRTQRLFGGPGPEVGTLGVQVHPVPCVRGWQGQQRGLAESEGLWDMMDEGATPKVLRRIESVQAKQGKREQNRD